MAKEPMVPAGSTAVPVDEAILVEQARSGDMGAFSRLVTRYQDRVLNACWRVCGNIDDAQDLTQEAFLHALESIESFRRRANFYTWLFRIAVNLSISHRRKAARADRGLCSGRSTTWHSLLHAEAGHRDRSPLLSAPPRSPELEDVARPGNMAQPQPKSPNDLADVTPDAGRGVREA